MKAFFDNVLAAIAHPHTTITSHDRVRAAMIVKAMIDNGESLNMDGRAEVGLKMYVEHNFSQAELREAGW